MPERKTYCFDIDGTLTIGTDGMRYERAEPRIQRLETVQALAREHEVLFYTARGFRTGADHRKLTLQQLRDWGCWWVGPEHLYAKPYADVYVDDRATTARVWFETRGAE